MSGGVLGVKIVKILALYMVMQTTLLATPIATDDNLSQTTSLIYPESLGFKSQIALMILISLTGAWFLRHEFRESM
ncbi:MAG: hypothetical protein IE880_04295 [Epsilonproteobacteria bacterium]|nr:hypothetical protein [Campylobacterota bacterium]MBD3807921.1 hypothetical protein [Campylobacterota bacterium]